jgi:fumarate hydratase subunit alpha
MKRDNELLIKSKVVELLTQLGYNTDCHFEEHLISCYDNEENEMARDILRHLIDNISIASEGNFPLCQDTGLVVFWVKSPLNINKILYEAVNDAFTMNNFRHSVVIDPIHRTKCDMRNTKSTQFSFSNFKNCPPIIHYEPVEGNTLEINVMLKGGGSENMSALIMLKPSDGLQGVRDFVLQTVKTAGGNACPPLIVGVGIGGNFETCALLAKKALFRMSGEQAIGEQYKDEEEYLLYEINKLNIGPMGLGGKTTALKVNIEVAPCHIASLPVAVNLECHAHRVGKLVIDLLK